MWSKTKKRLQSLICDSLKERVSFFVTQYRNAHDQYGRACILVDGKEVINMCVSKYNVAVWRKKEELERNSDYIPKYKSIYSSHWEAKEVIEEAGIFSEDDFFNAINTYFNNPIQVSIDSENMIVVILALLDRRIGRRTLEKLKERMSNQNCLIQYFYKLRCEAESIF